MKTAVFVEGHSELIFVREFLLRWYEWNVSLNCLQIRGDKIFEVPYVYGAQSAEIPHFQIINCGCDESVVGHMVGNAGELRAGGYTRIVALRDMYCDRYHKLCAGNRRVDDAVSRRIVDEDREDIMILKADPDNFSLCYAVMEIEAWLLAMRHRLAQVVKGIEAFDAEVDALLPADGHVETVYHPAQALARIYELAGGIYGKHQGDTEVWMKVLDRNDFVNLLESGKCASFERFVRELTA